jgi:hypothetical protein
LLCNVLARARFRRPWARRWRSAAVGLPVRSRKDHDDPAPCLHRPRPLLAGGNLHTHSTLSDGVLDTAEVCRRYKAEGYDFLALTDHFIGVYGYPIADTRPFRDNSFTTILGAELHSGAMENGELWHILAVGLPADFAAPNAPHFLPVAGQETGPEIAARAVAAGAYVAIAHPQWSGLSLNDARTLAGIADAVETYNHGCAMGCDRADGFAHARPPPFRRPPPEPLCHR